MMGILQTCQLFFFINRLKCYRSLLILDYFINIFKTAAAIASFLLQFYFSVDVGFAFCVFHSIHLFYTAIVLLFLRLLVTKYLHV